MDNHRKFYLILLILMFWFKAGISQSLVVDLPITISDNAGGSQQLRFGLDPSATDGIDASLGESELPPPPPTGVFDARFIGDDIGIDLGQGSLKDYRQGSSSFNGSKIHELRYQVGSGTTITISWSLPAGVTGLLQDLLGGIVVNVSMSGTGNTTITNPGVINKLKMTITYASTPIQSIQVISPNGGENWLVGSIQNITWTSSNITNIKIEYTTNNGTSWSVIQSSIAATPSSYSWTVSNTPSAQCKVRISDATDSDPLDLSDATFTISTSSLVAVDIPITITDNSGGTQQLRFGLDPAATNGIDASLGESELPPPPPTGVFDARFIGDDIGIDLGQGSLKDYRQGSSSFNGSKIHELRYQVGSGTTITISWNLPAGVTGLLQDLLGGIVVNVSMTGTGNTTITNPGVISKLKMTINYGTVSVCTLSVNKTYPDTIPSTGGIFLNSLDITLSGNGCQGWSIQNKPSWVSSINPSNSPTSASCTLIVTPNYGEFRSGIITVISEDAIGSPQNIFIRQAAGQIAEVSLNIFGPDTVANGQDFELQIRIENVSDLKVISFDLLFQTQYVDYVTNTIGTFLPEKVVIPDEGGGKVSVSVYSLTTGVSGTGNLITIKFRLASNTPNQTQLLFNFQNIQANDANGYNIPITPGAKTIISKSGISVWPGDSNNDGTVNIIDINPIIIHFGSTGPSRTPGSINWNAQLCQPWDPIAKTYADCNGNGSVDITDINAVIVNFGKTHSILRQNEHGKNFNSKLANPPLIIDCLPMRGQLAGQEFWLDVHIGSQSFPVNNMNVISFELKYSGTQYIDYVAYELGSFLDGANSIVLPDDLNGKISASAYNLTQGYTGYGQIFRFKFKVKDGLTNQQWIQFYWGLVSANSVGGAEQLVDTVGCSEDIIPVELTSFTFSIGNNEVLLNWSTATELNNKGFEIERSTDKLNWDFLGFIEGHGTTTSPQEYSFTDKTLSSSGKYFYRLKQINYDGSYSFSPEIEVEVDIIPLEFKLSQNHPNPFNPNTKINFAVQKKSTVKIIVFNILGERVQTLLDKELDAGFHEVDFNGTGLPSGIYLYRMIAGDFIETKKMILLR